MCERRRAPSRRFRLALAAGIVLLGACASVSRDPPLEPHPGLPASAAITGLPFYPQIEDQCGPASLATMLGARNISVMPETLRGKIYIPEKNGSLTTEIVARARRYGMLVYPLQQTLEPILQEVAAGNPVLVMQNLGFNWMPRWHFAIVTGYTLSQEQLVLRSGNDRALEVDFDLFEKTWTRAGRWAVVMTGSKQLPVTAQEATYLTAAHELEQVGEVSAALGAYETAITHWPLNAGAYFGAANTAYASEHYEHAIQHYLRYVTMPSSRPAGWNNLAYALMKANCPQASRQAIDCALQRAPQNPTFLHSQQELSALGHNPARSDCPTVYCPSPTTVGPKKH